MWLPRPTIAVLALLVLGCGLARADDAHKGSDDPDVGFLEFLGSVDRLADVNPDYLSQAEGRPKAGTGTTGATGTTPAPAPPQPAQPQNAPNGPGGHNNG
jgi:hypothetical protein